MEDGMKRLFVFAAIVLLALSVAPAVHGQTAEVIQGTQVRLTLLSGLSTSVAHEGDPFEAVVAEPVSLGNQIVLPAGAKVRGIVSNIQPPKRFALIRGGASMTLTFNSIEVDSRLLPAHMSLLGIYKEAAEGGKIRRDLSEVEGVQVQEKRDVKGYVLDAAIGTGGGSLVGTVFSHVVRGFGIGMIGSAAYIAVKRGKDVQLPAQTGLLVRLDNTMQVPVASTSASVATGTTK
jgi:hypothetical protein